MTDIRGARRILGFLASAVAIGLDPDGNGAEGRCYEDYEDVEVDLATDDLETALTSVAAGVVITGFAGKVLTSVAGTDNTTLTLIVSGGPTLATFDASTAGGKMSAAQATENSIAGTLALLLSGGTPGDFPTAGTVKVRLFYRKVTDLG